MRLTNYNNKSCIDFKDQYGRISNFTLLLTAKSGHGKGMSTEAIIERWKRTTGGVVIILHDPKKEAEFSFVNYPAKERYHLKELRKDGIKTNSYKSKLYHPFTFNLAKRGYLPEIDFYSISLKSLTKEDWSILAETAEETETITLLSRVAEYMPRNNSVFDFLLEVERLTEGKKGKKGSRDKKNWGLKGGGGTAKSIKQIGNMLSNFKTDYFLRKDTHEMNLDFDSVLLNPEPYHVFLTNWIESTKTRNFLVEYLFGQFVAQAQRLSDTGKLKTPILFVCPELNDVCPDEFKGSSVFLAKAFRKHLITFRSKAKGMSFLGDSQIWSQISPLVRGAFKETFYGSLNPEDARIVFKAKSYTASKRDLFKEVDENYCSYVWDGKEDFGVMHVLYPSHAHKEEKSNWIQMWKKNKLPIKKYDDMVNRVRKEFNEEEKVIDELEKKEREAKEKEKAKKEDKKEVKKVVKDDVVQKSKEVLHKRCWELHNDGMKDREIGRELGINHKTAKSYYQKYAKSLEGKKEIENDADDLDLGSLIGEGVMEEEFSSS